MTRSIFAPRVGLALGGLAILLAAQTFGSAPLSAQTYSRGQNVSPAYEGWEQNADGSFNFLFGYMNRNWEEELNVPVGPDNTIEPGGPDQGQPTRFLPRRNRFVFRVRVPKDWGQKEMVWTLTTKGKTEKAYASLRTDLFIDDVVIASETGSLGAGTSSPEIRSNKAPGVKIDGESQRRVKVGEPLSLVARVQDDGIPRQRPQSAPSLRPGNSSPLAQLLRTPGLIPPSRVTVGKRNGLHLSWYVYRGDGEVKFDQAQIKTWEDTRTGANSPWSPLWTPPPTPPDGKHTVTMTFDKPGTYVLRARADDGALFGDAEIIVTVSK
jgi:hypothetical protein